MSHKHNCGALNGVGMCTCHYSSAATPQAPPMTPPTSPLTEGPKMYEAVSIDPDTTGVYGPDGEVFRHEYMMDTFGDAWIFAKGANVGFDSGVAHATATQSARVEKMREALKLARTWVYRASECCEESTPDDDLKVIDSALRGE